MPQPYLLHVHSQPTTIAPQVYHQWYLEEHIRDMVYFKVMKNSAIYQSTSDALLSSNSNAQKTDSMPFLALYQTARSNCLESAEFKNNVRVRSRLWDPDLKKHLSEVCEHSTQQLKLVEVLGSYEFNEDVAPHVVHMHYSGPDVEGKIQFEHVNAVSILDGYRRTLLYRPAEQPVEGMQEVFLVHEFETLDPSSLLYVRQAMETIEPTNDCPFTLRSYTLLGCEGFGGQCRAPERLER
ncbi:uncharacterized protein LTR77_000730 [Saxophila tyrrhenica]|uniref:Uncharacterized protein n=1 Tax=Saxophila tyrrhenica TaxID=1690608 RepID=A0AAV9PP59_9PEZI|nr:hypothetical protein LTR77_000730 [Saxophila tyrrhenica]